MSFALPGPFWDRFAEEHWERRPLRLSSPFSSPLIDRGALFDSVVSAGERWSRGESVGLSFHVDFGLMQANVGARLPRASDRDLDGWAARLSAELPDRDFMLGLAPLQRFDRGAWLHAIEFLAPLYQRVGLPAKFAELELFLGCYRRTPFGTHRDTASNFMFVVEGKKRLALWPADYFSERKHPGWIFETIDDSAIEPHLADAVILEGDPGDVLYWPSSYWHTAIGDRSLGAAVAIALLLNAPDRRLAEDLLREAPSSGPVFRTLPFSAELPEDLRRAAALLERGAVAAPDHWLRRYTGFGFQSVPDLEANAIVPAGGVRLSPLARLAWVRSTQYKVKVAVFGHVVEVAHREGLDALLSALAAGETVSSERDADLLELLARAGALTQDTCS